ncbi:MAG TPA: tripartite tricarboxylate transporter substrate binding protein [Burkholderiaceae bacterium]|nr:tripartite tricarboxylate transporter substrate binding protein [Burkholderiaceae bacterium]
MNRRRCLATLCATLTATIPLCAWADAYYPARPVKLVVGFPPGSAADVVSRAVAEGMRGHLGQPLVVENKPGASSDIAAKVTASSPADGYTLFVATVANTINAGFPNSKSVDLSTDFVPVTMLGSVPNLLVVHPSVGVSSVDELIRAAKAKPGELAFASSGNGTSPHLSGELFSSMAGVKMLHVPYRGSSPAVADLLAGQVQLMFSPASTVLPHIRAGKLKALAATSAKRSDVAPELPTIAESGLKGFETSVWFGLVAPVGTPPAIVERIKTAAHAALDSADVQAALRAQGFDIVKAGPEEFARYIRREAEKWAKVIQSAGIRPE